MPSSCIQLQNELFQLKPIDLRKVKSPADLDNAFADAIFIPVLQVPLITLTWFYSQRAIGFSPANS